MDYDWKYYLDDLKNGKTEIKIGKEDRKAAGFLIYRMDKEKQGHVKKLIRWMLEDYKDGDRNKNALTECLVKTHADCCRRFPGNGMEKKCHNALVYRYMMKNVLDNRAVSAKMCVSHWTVQNYIDKAVGELMVLCFGTPAITGSIGTWQDAVKQILHNMHFLECPGNTGIELVWDKWQQERIYCQQVTNTTVKFMYKISSMYEEFINSSSNKYIQKRALDIIKELYITGGKSISEVSTIWNISEHSVYADIRKITARLGELCLYMAGEEDEVIKEK